MIIELIDWNGGEMPVDEGTQVLIVQRDGFIGRAEAGWGMAIRWTHNGGSNDIIAYKVLDQEEL